ncbi:GNAT family N-acetyltransferase [Halobacteriales archaeon QS_8_69_26]|nr:MAG: GNAT family N-acetyltransferase [Halobacteriales archaeon QS_8_69_26]
MFPERIETERLELELLTTGSVDTTEFYRICSGQADEGDFSEVTEHLTWSAHDHPKETLEFLRRVEEKAGEDEGATYAIYPKEDEERAGELAGAAGIRAHWDRRTAGFGVWLRRPFWGRGYSGERAAAFVEVAFEHLDLELVAVSHEVGNDQSRRAIEKYVEAHGGHREGRFRNRMVGQDGGDPVDVVRYSISREEYEAATADRDPAIVAME